MAVLDVSFVDPGIVERQNPAFMVAAQQQSPLDGAAKFKRGLSPFMLELNRYLQAARLSKGSSLTRDECARAREDFRRTWSGMVDHDVHKEAYQEWRTSLVEKSASNVVEYRQMWGGGCHATPVTKEELWSFHNDFGCPSDLEVVDAEMLEVGVVPDFLRSFVNTSGYDLWGISRAAINIDRESLADKTQFETVHKGLNNVVGSMPKAESEFGDVMVMIQGFRLGHPDQPHRLAFLVTGVSFSPKVFDVTRCAFSDASHAGSAELPLPSNIRISTRSCRVSDKFMCIDSQTSAELVCELCKTIGEMELFIVQYDVLTDLDGSLMWSRIDGLKPLGTLWAVGQRTPWTAKPDESQADEELKRARATMNELNASDPFAAPAPGRARQPSACGVKRKGMGGDGAPRAAAADLLAIGDGPSELEGSGGRCSHGSSGTPVLGSPSGSIHHGADCEGEKDMAERECDDLDEEDLLELEATYSGIGHSAPVPHVSGVDDAEGRVEEPLASDRSDDATSSAIASHFLEVAHGVGLADEALAGNGASSSSSGVPPLQEPEEADELPLWASLTGPSPLGYCNLGLRSVLRIQRHKPKGRCSVTCYRHSACTLLINMPRCPEDLELKKWLFEVPPSEPNATRPERQALAHQHMALGRARWIARIIPNE